MVSTYYGFYKTHDSAQNYQPSIQRQFNRQLTEDTGIQKMAWHQMKVLVLAEEEYTQMTPEDLLS
jgi:hypothetical protein